MAIGGALQKPRWSIAVASATYTTTTTTAAFSMGMADCYTLFGVHTSASGTSPTFDWSVQTSVDKGTTYITLPLKFTQVTASGSSSIIFNLGLGESDAAAEQVPAATGNAIAKNCIFDPDFMKLAVTVGGSTPSIVTVWYLGCLMKGTRR